MMVVSDIACWVSAVSGLSIVMASSAFHRDFWFDIRRECHRSVTTQDLDWLSHSTNTHSWQSLAAHNVTPSQSAANVSNDIKQSLTFHKSFQQRQFMSMYNNARKHCFAALSIAIIQQVHQMKEIPHV